jgi:hypothetical protein
VGAHLAIQAQSMKPQTKRAYALTVNTKRRKEIMGNMNPSRTIISLTPVEDLEWLECVLGGEGGDGGDGGGDGGDGGDGGVAGGDAGGNGQGSGDAGSAAPGDGSQAPGI